MTVPLKTLVPDRRQLILPDHLYSTAISTESTNIHRWGVKIDRRLPCTTRRVGRL
jgi:hypothetical protein